VKKGMDENTNKFVALKFMTRDDMKMKDLRQVQTEIKSMVRINSPHVVKLYGFHAHCKYFDRNGKVCDTIMLILEYCPGGELFDIVFYTNQLDNVTARTYFVQLLNGLKSCHDAGIVHRDIKPSNLLLDKDYKLKITDFGQSHISKEKQKDLNTRCGTPGFQAPEIRKGENYTKSCDIFSCGVVLFILLTGHPPFVHASSKDKWYRPMCEKNPEAF